MVECFVLAGGLSRRFGEDKLIYPISGKKVIEHTLDALKEFCERLCLVTKHKEKFSFLTDVEIVEDLIQKQFALAGLYTALKSLRGEKALVVAGDMPLIKREVVRLLIEKAEPPITLFRVKGRLYPLFAVYYKQVLPELENYLNAGGEKVLDFVERLPYKKLEEANLLVYDRELLSFINMNTKADAEYILKVCGGEEISEGLDGGGPALGYAQACHRRMGL